MLASGATAIAGLRRARLLRHPDAAGVRDRHGRRPVGLAARRARRAARGAGAGRAARRAAAAPARAAAEPIPPCRREGRRDRRRGRRARGRLHHLQLADAPRRSSRAAGAGRALPPFAMPLATSASGGDANVATQPGQDQLGPVPACDVRRPGVLNSCALAERGPVVLAFVVTGVDECARAGRRARPGRAGGSRAWRSPRSPRRRTATTCASACGRAAGPCRSATTTTGSSANLYGFGAVCPLLVFADARGRVAATHVGALDEARADGARAGAGGGAAAVVSARDPELVAAAVDPLVAAEHPGLRVWTARVAGRHGADAGGAARAPRAARRPAARPRGGRAADAAGAVGLPRALPPPRARPGRHAHAARGARRRPAAARRLRGARAARGRARARDAGDRRRGLGARRGRRRRAHAHDRRRTAGSRSATTAAPPRVLFSPPAAGARARPRHDRAAARRGPGAGRRRPRDRGGAVDGGRRVPTIDAAS